MTAFRCCIVLLIAFVVGCNQQPKYTGIPTEYVEGIVLLDGVPTEGVTVSFVPMTAGKGEMAFGTTNAEGKFQLTCAVGVPQKGTLEGEYIVTLSKLDMVASADPRDMIPTDPQPAGRFGMPPPRKELLPTVYQDKQNPVFTKTVQKGKNTFEFRLESDH